MICQEKCIKIKTVNSTGSCFGFRVPFFCNASLFCVMRWHITQNVWGGGGHTTRKWHIVIKGDALQKAGTHNLQTGTRNTKQEPTLFLSS